MVEYGVLDQKQRQLEKEQSRLQDAEDLRLGRITKAELARRNGFFSSISFKGSHILAIGEKELKIFRAKELENSQALNI